MSASKTATLEPKQATPRPDWRDALTVDEQRSIDGAREYAEFWAGMPTNDVRILLDKMARILDGLPTSNDVLNMDKGN